MSADSLKSIPFPTPSIEHPFGFELWPVFSQAFSLIRGYKPEDFKFVAGETPMSTMKATATTLASYYIVVLGGRELMKGRKPMQLNGLFMIHNLYLTLVSGTLLALFIEQLVPTIWKHGLFYAICDHSGGWTPQLVILYYVGSSTSC